MLAPRPPSCYNAAACGEPTARVRPRAAAVMDSHRTEATPLTIYLNIVQILISLALIVLTVMQRKSGGLGSLGGDSSIYHTRRGVEKSLHNLTIALAIAFALTSLLSVIFQ